MIYSQTGTGKTYTMVGEEQPTLTSTQEDASNVGIIPRALNHLFDELRMMQVEFAMRVSYLELYNEELCDLLSTDDTAKIRIYDDVSKKGSVIVQGLEEIPVRCKSDVYRLLAKGQERRRTAATLMNAQSSRSHTVFSILVHIKENGNDGEEMLKIGKLNLVDLAGSENISKAGNEKGIRTRESVNINQSLLTLGRVITALVERTPHIPYRESKLTRLLQESLGGRTKTSIIATVSPGHKDLEETLSTLDYAHRAKHIQNKPEINQRLTKKVVLKEYTEEIDKLKRDLIAAREKNGIYLATDTYHDMLYKMETQQKELNEKIHLFKNLKEELTDKNRAFDECQRNLDEISTNLVLEQGKARITEAELKTTKRNLRRTERHHEESKHIIECHQKTEQALTDHAQQLIGVAEEASVDTQSLLESIDRRRNVEETAVSATDLLLKNISNNMNDMRSEMEHLAKKHKENSKLVVTDLDENTKSNKQFSSSFNKSLKDLKTFRNDSGVHIEKVVSEWTTSYEKSSQDDTDKLNIFLKEMEQQQTTFNDKVSEKIRSMEQVLLKISSDNDSMRSQLLEKINFQNAEINKFCSEMQNKIAEQCREFSQASDQMKNHSEAKKAKLSEIKRLLAEVDVISNECSGIQENLDSGNERFLKTETSNIQNFNEKNSVFLNDNDGILKTFNDANMEMKEKVNKNFTIIDEHIKENEGKMKENLSEANNLVASMSSQLKTKLIAVQESVREEIHKATQVDEKNIESIAEMTQKENVRSLVKCQEVKSLVQQTLSLLVNTADTNISNNISKSKSEIKQFEEEDILKYKPTGETPARKEYKFNKDLVSTSPHDRIIKRLRMDRGGLSDSQFDSSILEVSS